MIFLIIGIVLVGGVGAYFYLKSKKAAVIPTATPSITPSVAAPVKSIVAPIQAPTAPVASVVIPAKVVAPIAASVTAPVAVPAAAPTVAKPTVAVPVAAAPSAPAPSAPVVPTPAPANSFVAPPIPTLPDGLAQWITLSYEPTSTPGVFRPLLQIKAGAPANVQNAFSAAQTLNNSLGGIGGLSGAQIVHILQVNFKP